MILGNTYCLLKYMKQIFATIPFQKLFLFKASVLALCKEIFKQINGLLQKYAL